MGKSKYTNDFKQIVLFKKIDKELAHRKRKIFIETHSFDFDENGVRTLMCTDYKYIDFQIEIKRDAYLDCADRLNETYYRKAKRVREKINDLVTNGNSIFVTLTFNNDTIAKTNEITRRRYVARYLKENCTKYVANIDYGGKYGREHYHAIVDNTLNLKNWHKYGAIKIERIRTQQEDLKRVSKYVTKLTHHALKLGYEAPRLIYSRDKG